MKTFLGHTRFSLLEPSSPSWRLSREIGKTDRETYKKILFSEERLSSRTNIFLKYTLPTIDLAASQHRIRHIVSYPVELPAIYKDRLLEAAKHYDWLYLDERSKPKNTGRFLDSFAKKHFKPGTIYGEYRLDDDDVLSTAFFDTLSLYISEVHVRSMVSLGLGVQCFYDDGAFLEPRLEHRPKIAIGLTRVCKVTENRVTGPPRVAHTRSDRVCTVVLDSKNITYLHTLHLTQDSGVVKPEGDLTRRVRNYLRLPLVPDDFNLKDLFPGIYFDESKGLPGNSRPAKFHARLTMAAEEIFNSRTNKDRRSALQSMLKSFLS